MTRYGRTDSSFAFLAKRQGTPTDVALGRRRARAAALLAAALPGSLYIYQGDELGLDEVEDLPRRADPGPDALPVRRRRSRARRLPGAAAVVRRRAALRLQPGRRDRRAVAPPASAAGRPDGRGPGRRRASMLSLYRAALRIRRSDPDLRTERFAWLAVRAGRRSPSGAASRFVAITNLGSEPVAAPRGAELLLSSRDARRRLPAGRRHRPGGGSRRRRSRAMTRGTGGGADGMTGSPGASLSETEW